jgi:hypothetical protein
MVPPLRCSRKICERRRAGDRFCSASEMPGKIVGIDLRQFQDAAKRTNLQLAMERDDRAHLPVGRRLRKAHMIPRLGGLQRIRIVTRVF